LGVLFFSARARSSLHVRRRRRTQTLDKPSHDRRPPPPPPPRRRPPLVIIAFACAVAFAAFAYAVLSDQNNCVAVAETDQHNTSPKTIITLVISIS